MEADLMYMLQPSRMYIGDNINVFRRGKDLRIMWAHKILFNLLPQFSRLGTRDPASLSFINCLYSVLCFIWAWVEV